MNYHKMDPYQDISSVPTAGSVVGSFAKAALNPVNLPVMFPNMLDINKGIAVPIWSKYNISPSSIKSAWQKPKNAFFKNIKRKTEKRLFAGRLGTYHDAKYMYLDRKIALSKAKEAYRTRIKNTKFLTGIDEIQTIQGKTIEKIKNQLKDPIKLKEISKFANNKGTMNAINYLSSTGKSLTRGYLLKTKLLRMGMRVAKLGAWASTIGAFASIGYMIGEPIGRSIVSNATDAINKFSSRFMPEMSGSRLQDGFLTQGAATERQRAIEALSKSSLNGRSAFGQESLYFHQ